MVRAIRPYYTNIRCVTLKDIKFSVVSHPFNLSSYRLALRISLARPSSLPTPDQGLLV